MRETSFPLRAALFLAGVAVSYAAAVLLLFPTRSEKLFAWDIQPPVTAAFMGAFYLTAIPLLFIVSRRGTRWLRVRPILPTLFTLSTAMLVATILHLELFNRSSIITWFWAGLYLLYPPLIAVLYLQHARSAGAPEPAPDPHVMSWLRPSAYGFAIVVGAAGLALMIAPETMARFWPWELTPLTGRVVAGWLLFLASAVAAMGRERDWTAIRLLFPQAALVLTLLLLNAIRFSGSFAWEQPEAWIYVGVVALGLITTVFVYARHEGWPAEARRR
jgi:hypothetical protein